MDVVELDIHLHLELMCFMSCTASVLSKPLYEAHIDCHHFVPSMSTCTAVLGCSRPYRQLMSEMPLSLEHQYSTHTS